VRQRIERGLHLLHVGWLQFLKTMMRLLELVLRALHRCEQGLDPRASGKVRIVFLEIR